MAVRDRISDPTQIPVQLNIQVPWQFREDLIDISIKRRISLSELVRSTLYESLFADVRDATRGAGATK